MISEDRMFQNVPLSMLIQAGQTQLEVPVPQLSYLEWPLLMAKERGRQQPSSGPHSLFHSEVVQRARSYW